jgi:SAM-dependent methyltransferase
VTNVDFEARYRSDPDPWGYTERRYERDKYLATLAACGSGPFGRALELGGSIGVFSALLAPRCRRLDVIDSAPTAVRQALKRLAAFPSANVILGEIPRELPDVRYDLVVASEVLYYLSVDALRATIEALATRMRPGARLIAVHWRPGGPERPLTAQTVHETLRELPWLRSISTGGTDDYLLDVLEQR